MERLLVTPKRLAAARAILTNNAKEVKLQYDSICENKQILSFFVVYKRNESKYVVIYKIEIKYERMKKNALRRSRPPQISITRGFMYLL